MVGRTAPWLLGALAGLMCAMVLAGAGRAQESDDLTKLQDEVNQLRHERKYVEALAAQRTLAAAVEKEEVASAGRPGRKTAEALGSLAWNALFARDYVEALAAAKRGFALAPHLLWIETNRAHALLFLGRSGEARELYLAHKDRRAFHGSDETWEEAVAADFNTLREAGSSHAGFAEIVAALGLIPEIEALRVQVKELYKDRKYVEALSAAEKYVALSRERFGDEATEVAKATDWLARVYRAQSRFAEAEPFFRQSLAIREKALGPEQPSVAQSLHDLALLYDRQRRYREAEALYQRSLAIRVKSLGPEHPDVSTTLNNLAVVYQNLGRHADAVPLHMRSIAIDEKTLGPEHPDVAISLQNLADLFERQGRHADAEPLARRSLAIFEKSGRPEQVRLSLSSLAGLYLYMGRYAEAEPLFGRSLALTEKALGPAHPDVATSLGNLATVYLDQGRYAEAEFLHRRGLAIRETSLGSNHTAVGGSLNNLGHVYRKQGRNAEAEPLYKRSLAIAEKAMGAEHVDVGVALHGLGQVYRDEGRYGEAEPLLKRALFVFEKALGTEHGFVGTAQHNLALLYARQGRHAEAEPLYQHSLAIREKALGPDHRDIAQSLHDIAALYQSQDQHAEAERLYRRSLVIREKALGPDHPDVGQSLDGLAELYKSQGRDAEAERLHGRSLAIRGKLLAPSAVGTSFNELAKQFESQYSWEEAEVLYRHSLAIRETLLHSEHPDVGSVLTNLARLYERQSSRESEAERLYERSAAIREKALGSEHPDAGTALYTLATLAWQEGRKVEAGVYYRRSLAVREKVLGPEHPDVVRFRNTLVEHYLSAGRYREVESLAESTLAVSEKALGPEHPEVGTALDHLARVYVVQRRHADAEPLRTRVVAIREKTLGTEHLEVSNALYYLAELYESQHRHDEALPLYTRALAIREKAQGPEHPQVGLLLGHLAELYQKMGRTSEAEPFYNRSLAIRSRVAALNDERVRLREAGKYGEAVEVAEQLLRFEEKSLLPPDHNDTGVALNNLAQLYLFLGRYADAEPLLRRSLDIVDKYSFGQPDHNVAVALHTLGDVYYDQGRYAEAEPLFKRSLAISEKGPFRQRDERMMSYVLNSLAALYQVQGQLTEAEPLYKRSLALREKVFGAEHREVGAVLSNLAGLQSDQSRILDAEPLYKRSLGILEKQLSQDHPDVGAVLHNLARVYHEQGRVADAEPMYRRSLSISEKALGPDHPSVVAALNSLAELAYLQSDWAGAAGYWRRSTSIMQRRAERGVADGRGEASGGEARRLAWPFWGLVSATYRLVARGPTPALTAEMFERAQWMQRSEVAASLAQMAARSAKGSPELATLVRERQDLAVEWQVKDRLLVNAKSKASSERKAEAEAEKALADRLAAIDRRLAEIDRRFAQGFPDHAALASPTSVSVAEVQSQLVADEALVLFLNMPERKYADEKRKPFPEETFVWVVTKSQVRWVRSGLGTAALAQEVAALRCGLDATAWYGEGAEKCETALNIPVAGSPGLNQPLPFDHARAHKLYLALLGQARDLIRGKHLLIVPSGPLTQLPFQVLVTRPPAEAVATGVRPAGSDTVVPSSPCVTVPGAGACPMVSELKAVKPEPTSKHRSVAWLAREHTVTVLPAVSSLKALRRVGKPSVAPRPMIGFGNPLLEGPNTHYANLAKLARDKETCLDGRRGRLVALSELRGSVKRVETRGALADVSLIKSQVPLPETADELCAVAQDVKAEASDIHLGTRATEREVKRLSASGELAKYRMVHFATHGVLAGQLDGTQEPGLILTPPDSATEQDDGYLTASEIAALKLDADWVILSACNTAAGAATSAEALSGLARAFIYAQARALLVSHWEVNSDATVKLITVAIREMARDPKVGRADALRRSMLALIDKGEPHETHPAYWAPFVVVGEGASANTLALPVARSESKKSFKAKATPKKPDDWAKRAFGSQ